MKAKANSAMELKTRPRKVAEAGTGESGSLQQVDAGLGGVSNIWWLLCCWEPGSGVLGIFTGLRRGFTKLSP